MKKILPYQCAGGALSIMKILSVQNFLALLLASSVYAHELSGQSMMDTKISVEFKDTSHKKILLKIEEIAGVDRVIHWMSRALANQAGRLSNGSCGEGWNVDNLIAKAEEGGVNLKFQPFVLLNLTNLRYDGFDNRFLLLLLPALCVESMAWHTQPHQQITRAAIETLPLAMQKRLKPEIETLVMVNCMYPDTYRELGNWSPRSPEKDFNPGPTSRAEMKVYCEMPDGRNIHNVTQNRQEDLESFKYLLTAIIKEIRRDNITSASKFMGTLAHLIEDSTSPAHAGNLSLVVKELQERQHLPNTPPWVGRVDEHGGALNLHAMIELTTPPFSLEGRPPKMAGKTVSDAVPELLDRCYAIIQDNRADLLEMVRAVYFEDMPVIEHLRSRAARQGAELLADAYFTAFSLATK